VAALAWNLLKASDYSVFDCLGGDAEVGKEFLAGARSAKTRHADEAAIAANPALPAGLDGGPNGDADGVWPNTQVR
jgi:hypothetical protein